MTAKPTFYEPRKKARIRRGQHPGGVQWVADTDDELDNLIATAKATYKDGEELATAQEVKATLKKLTELNDADTMRAVRAVDGRTEAVLMTAAMMDYRKQHKTGDIPAEVGDWKRGPEYVRRIALAALETYRGGKGGAPSTKNRDMQFAIALVRWWEKTKNETATVTKTSDRGDWSPFATLAIEAFHLAGRHGRLARTGSPGPLADMSAILHDAVRAVHGGKKQKWRHALAEYEAKRKK